MSWRRPVTGLTGLDDPGFAAADSCRDRCAGMRPCRHRQQPSRADAARSSGCRHAHQATRCDVRCRARAGLKHSAATQPAAHSPRYTRLPHKRGLLRRLRDAFPARPGAAPAIRPGSRSVARAVVILTELIVSGLAHIREVNRALHLELPEDGPWTTLAGFVLSIAARIPKSGEKFEADNGVGLEIIDASARRIRSIRIVAPPSAAPTGGEALASS